MCTCHSSGGISGIWRHWKLSTDNMGISADCSEGVVETYLGCLRFYVTLILQVLKRVYNQNRSEEHWPRTAEPYLHTSLPLENIEARMTSGAIQAYVPAALILVVRCHSRARPKSVIFKILLLRSPFSTFWRINTGQGKEYKRNQSLH